MAEVVKKVWVDEPSCTSCEACIATCPEVFEMKNDVATVKTEAAAAEFLKANSANIVQAAQDCPSEAIKYETT